MRFDLLSPDNWDRVCDQYRSRLEIGGDATQTIQVYQGFSPAILECAQGIAKIFAHKKTIAIPEFGEPCLQTLAQVFAADGYTVIELKSQDLENPLTFFEQHKDDLLFVAHGDDDPVTGARAELKNLPEFFKDKRVFRIHVSHSLFKNAALRASLPFEAQILSLTAERALMVGGSRCKIRPLITPLLNWNPERENFSHTTDLSNSVARHLDNREGIESFEAALPEPLERCFEAGVESRVFDRAVFWSSEFDGLALIQEIACLLQAASIPAPDSDMAQGLGLGLNDLPAGFATSSPCFWQSERLVEWRKSLGESDAKIRGLIGLSPDLDLVKVQSVLPLAIARLRARQNG